MHLHPAGAKRMNWDEFVRRVAGRSKRPEEEIRRVLEVLPELGRARRLRQIAGRKLRFRRNRSRRGEG